MSSYNHFPRAGEGVWHHKHGNGVVHVVSWDDGEIDCVYVKFHNKGNIEEYDIAEFTGNWTDKFGGLWKLDE